MSDAARHAAFYTPETDYGVTPTTPAFKPVRHTGMTLGVQRGSLQSEELRPDRQISDFRLGAISVAGDVKSELSFASFDDFLEAVLMGTWTPKALMTAATTIGATASDSSFNDSNSGFIAAGFAVGDIIVVSGFTETDMNGRFKIVTLAAGKITVTAPNGDAIEFAGDENLSEPITIQSAETVLKAGTVRRSFSMLRHFTDIEATGDGMPFHLFRGVEFNTLALAVKPTAIVSAAFGVLGREGVSPSNTSPDGATFSDVLQTSPLDAFSGQLKHAGTVVGEVSEFSANLTNDLAVRNVVGSKLTLRPSVGRSNVTGSATVYFEDASFVKKFIDEEATSLSVELPDGEGNSYIITIPKFKFTGGQPDVSGQGSITLTMPFQAVLDAATGSNIIINRIPAAV